MPQDTSYTGAAKQACAIGCRFLGTGAGLVTGASGAQGSWV